MHEQACMLREESRAHGENRASASHDAEHARAWSAPRSADVARFFQVSLSQPFVCVLQIVLDPGFPLRVDLKRAEPGDDTVIACNRSPIVSSHLSLSLFFLSSLSLSLSPEVGAPVPTWRGARRMRSWLGSCKTAG